MYDPEVICICYIDRDQNMLGGIRVELISKSHPLPICSAIGKYDATIITDYAKYPELKVGEICGMWTDRRAAGIGVGNGLVRFAMLTLMKVNASLGTCLCTDYTKMLVEKHGFTVATKYGNQGTLLYPDERYIATVMILKKPSISTIVNPRELEMMNRLILGERKCSENIDQHLLNLDIKLCFD